MAFCKACGQDIGTANFCPKCGANQSAAGAAPAATVGSTGAVAAAPVGSAAASPTESLPENVAGLLCYLPGVGWIIAIAFFLIDKRRFVKFHAVQALGIYVGMIALYMVLGMGMILMHAINIFFLGMLLYPMLGLACFVLLLFLMYKAYLKEEFKIPVIGDFAMGIASK